MWQFISQTIHLWVLDKSPLLGPEKGVPFLQLMGSQRVSHDLATEQQQGGIMKGGRVMLDNFWGFIGVLTLH